MKNALIVVLVLSVGIMSYFLFTRDDSLGDSGKRANQAATEESLNRANSSGKTIDLSNKGLSELSKNILDDSSVTVFNVSGNNFTGSLPAEIRKLTNLEVLIAADNNMTGIPAEIGQLSKLRTVNFANNNLSGLPQEIGKLKNLELLDLRGNPNISKYDVSIIQNYIPNAKILTD